MPAKARFAPPKPEPESEEESEETISDDEEGEEIDPIEIINSMTVHQRRKIYALKGLQKEFRELRKKFLEEISQAELDFSTKTASLREERRKVVAGERDVTAEEMKTYQDVKQESGVEEIPSDEDENEQKKQKKAVTVVSKGDEKNKSDLVVAAEKPDGGIPGFWFTVLRNNEVTEGMITERDAPCLQSLTDVTKEYIDNNPRRGFKLNFHFAENEYFTNKVLTKTYNFDQEPETQDDDEPMLDTIQGAEIDWKSPEKKLTVILKQKKQRHKTGKGVRVVTKEEKCPSFFHFFEAPQVPEDDEEEDEDEEMSYDEKMEMDYEAATMFADQIIPRAVHYYSGRSIEEIASAMDFAGLMGGPGGDDDEEEEEEEEEEEAPKGKKGGKAPKGPKGSGGKGAQPECKQQ